MNALIRKEVRLLLPAWLVALVLAVVPPCLVSRPNSFGGWGLFGMLSWLGVVLLAISSFGREFSAGTFSQLLGLPTQRKRIWKAKTATLAAATLSVFIIHYVAFNLRAVGTVMAPTYWLRYPTVNSIAVLAFLTIAGVLMFTAFAGSLWTVLLFRQMAAAFWFVVLLPFVIVLPTNLLVSGSRQSLWYGGLALLLYSIAGYLLARRLFLRAQDVGWTGGEVTLSFFRRRAAQRAQVTDTPRRQPLRALLRKELQLQSISLFFGGSLLVGHLLLLATRKAAMAMVAPSVPWWDEVLASFALVWFAVPGLLGCVAVAEERKLGTLEAHLSLPVARRRQFWVKLATALFWGVLLGAVCFGLLESVGHRLRLSSALMPPNAEFDVFWVLRWLTITAALIVLISFYASTLARNTLEALGLAAVLGIGGAFLVWFAAAPEAVLGFAPWRGDLMWWIGGLLLVTTILVLAYGNYKRLHEGGRVWRRNVLTVACVLIVASAITTLIYHRTWELLTPLEPRHSPARITGKGNTKLCLVGERIFILLPDGRLWATPERKAQREGLGFPRAGSFLSESNWVDLAGTAYGVAGIRADGSLWSLFQIPQVSYTFPASSYGVPALPSPAPRGIPYRRLGQPGMPSVEGTPPSPPAPSGAAEPSKADNTEELAAFQRRYGLDSPPQAIRSRVPPKTVPGQMAGPASLSPGLDSSPQTTVVRMRAISSPARTGADSDWKSLAAGRGHFLALKRDGSLWGWGGNGEGQLGEGPEWMTNGPVRIGKDSDWAAVFASGFRSAGAKHDGSLWVWGSLDHLPDGTKFKETTRHPTPVRWNLEGTNVVSFIGSTKFDMVLGADGTAHAIGFLPPGLVPGKPLADNLRARDGLWFCTTPYQVGASGTWRQIALGEFLLAIRKDGSLWKQEDLWSWVGKPGALVKVSAYSDWIMGAIYGGSKSIALAADGTLCCWASSRFYPPDALLAPSRRPLWSLNIFESVKPGASLKANNLEQVQREPRTPEAIFVASRSLMKSQP